MNNTQNTHLVCVNPKTYRLTQGQQYEILKKEKGYVFVENDNGKVARYDETLFESPTPARTEQDCINSIEIIDQNTIHFVNLQNQPQEISFSLVGSYNNNFSCGIVRIESINSTIQQIENAVNTSEEDLIMLKRNIFKNAIKAKLNQHPTRGMWMCSTNQNTDYEDYFNELNEMTDHNSGWFRNPNSGNQINMWYGIINQPN